ncbi:MAG: hypothetical protein AB7S40_08675 [Bacteroidales bacterium]
MQNFIYLIIHILFALGMFISLKLINIKGVNIYKAITINYAVAAFLNYANLSFSQEPWLYRIEMLLPSAGVAFLFVVSFILMSYSTQKVGIGLTTALNKMSVLIPVTVGILYLGQDNQLPIKLTGIAIALASFVLILYKKSENRSKGAVILPLMVFIVSGMIDTSMELSHNYVIRDIHENEVFLLSVFSFSVLFSLMAVLVDSYGAKRKRSNIENKNILSRTIWLGSMLGVFNFLTSKMILINVGSMGGSVVYPIHNASVVTFTALIGLFFFKEKFTARQWAGVILAVLGVSMIASTL